MGDAVAWYRIDNRLVHGQVIENWIPYTRARSIVVVNDDLAADDLQKEIIGLAVPNRIKLVFTPVNSVMDKLKELFPSGKMERAFFLFANCGDARRAFEKGLTINLLNIGNIHYGPGKKAICAHVALSKDDMGCLRFMTRNGVNLDFRCVPNTPVQVKDF